MAVPVAGMAKMAGSAVGQVGIQLALEKAFFKKDVDKTTKETESAFAKSFGKIERTTKSAFSSMGKVISNRLEKVKENFHKIGTTIKVAFAVGTAFMTKFAKDAVSLASETQSAWTGLNSIVTGTGKSFSEAQKFLKEYTKDGLIPLTDAVASYKNLASRGYETEQIEGIMTALKDSASFGRVASYSYGEAIKTATEGLKNENSILVDNAGVTKNVAKMWDEYAQSIGTTANNLTLAQKRLAEYNGIMEETKFQTGDAQRYAETYAGKIAKVSTAFYNLKVTVGQVVAPIVELFLPVIEKSINALTRLFNKLKSVMAVFGLEMKEYIGKDTSSAISGATDSTSALSDGLDSAGKTATSTAKKIKKAFAGVDEINVLNMGNNSSGSDGGTSGGSGAGVGGGISDTTITDGLGATEETITQNLEWLTRSAYDWGVAFGEAINNGLGKIPWNAIQTTVVGAVTKVAEFLNGAVKGLDWHLLGSTFGEGFNTIIYGLNAWYKTFDWANFGKGLGDGINGIIDSVDWKATGEYFALKFNSLFETLNGFFKTVKWGELGKNLIEGLNKTIETLNLEIVGETLKNAIDGAIDFVWNGFETFDAKNAGAKVGELIDGIAKAIANIDWKQFGNTISTGLNKLMDFLSSALFEINWITLVYEIIEGIVDVFVGIDWLKLMGNAIELFANIGIALVEGIVGGITSAVIGIGRLLYDILVNPIVTAVKKLFGINSPSKVFAEIGEFLIEGLWQGIANMKNWIIEKWQGVKNWFSDIVKTAKVNITQKWSDIKSKWTSITNNIKDKTADMKAKIVTTWSNLKSKWSNITKNIKDKTANMKAQVTTTWSNIKSKWNSLMANFKDKTVKIIPEIQSVKEGMKKWLNDKFIKPVNKAIKWTGINIPYLAQGGWVKANSPQLAVIGDNKREPEIVAPESKIYDQTRKAVEDAGLNPTSQQIDLTIKLEYPDGKYLIKEINNAQIKDGKISLLV